MPFTLVAYYQSVDPGGAFVNLDAVADPHVTVSGKDILIPELSRLVMATDLVDTTVAPQARIRTPSLLVDGFEEYLPRHNAQPTFASNFAYLDRRANPLELVPVEAMQFQVLSDPASAVAHYGLVWLADGPLAPVTGRIRTIRATASIAQSAGAWVNGALTFPVSLKAGRYQVVGMRIVGTGLVAGRLVFPGQAWRPGVPALTNHTDAYPPGFGPGELGVFGEFVHSSPPTLDVLGGTGTSQVVYLDVIYLG